MVNFCGSKSYVQINVDALPGNKEKEGGDQSKPSQAKPRDMMMNESTNSSGRTCNWSQWGKEGQIERQCVWFWKKRKGEGGREWWIKNNGGLWRMENGEESW